MAMTALRGHRSNNILYGVDTSHVQGRPRNLQTHGQGESSDASQESLPLLTGHVHQEVGSGVTGSTMPGYGGSNQSVLPTITSSIPSAQSSPLANHADISDPEFNLDEWQGETIPGNFTDGTSQFINDTATMETPIEPLPVNSDNVTSAVTTGTIGSMNTTMAPITTPEVASNATSLPPTTPGSSTNTTMHQTTIPSAASNTTSLSPPTTPSIPTSDNGNSNVTEDFGQASGNPLPPIRPTATEAPNNDGFNTEGTMTQRPTYPPAEDHEDGGDAGEPPEDTYHDGQHPTADDDAVYNTVNENPANDMPASSPSTIVSGESEGPSTASPTSGKSSATCGSPLLSRAVLTCHRRIHPVPYYASFFSVILVFVCLLRYCFCRRNSNGGAYDSRGEYRQVAAQYGHNGFDNTFSDELSQESDDIGFTDDMEDDSWGNSGQKVLELGTFRSTEQNGGLSLAEMNG